ncbi:MAG: hypothetical protein AAF789_10250 [Bacteroidota bacterium]
MIKTESPESPWPIYQQIAFRFFAIYFILSTAIWSWMGTFPWFSFLGTFGTWFNEGYTNIFNQYIYTIKEELVPTRGSGDTSMGWATLYAQLFIALVGTIIWSIVDRKRRSYKIASLVIRNVVRYYVILFAFIYGLIKIFGLQMPAPSNSYYATDLGHFSAMRFSWNFVGYSNTYQFFSGFAELLVGLLLLYRRTVVLGSVVGIGVFAYVFLLNMTFDIPVKIFSFQLFFACLFLSFNNLRRLTRFFLLNKPVSADQSWDLPFTLPWFKPARLVIKAVFIGCFAIYPLYNYSNVADSREYAETPPPFESGFYRIDNFVLNGDTIPPSLNSNVHWSDLAIDNAGRGSIGLIDSASFRVRYGRSYFFNYAVDSTTDRLTIKRYGRDTLSIFEGAYFELEDRGLQLSGIYKTTDTLTVDLLWDNRNYQLAKKEFNWMLESVP